MRVIHIIPGSGGSFYCENCFRDSAVVKAMRAMGHDATLVPLYLPLFLDYPDVTTGSPVFFGAVSLYLRERVPLLRRLPLRRLRFLDSPRILRWAAKQAERTRASGLEELTLSMLRGEHGRQAAELDQLAAWLETEGKPDVVHLSNALLLGLARRIRDRLNVPIVCSLQDEDTWIDAMGEHAANRIWETLAERARDVDLLIPVSESYSGVVAEKLGIPAERMRVIHIGIDPDGYVAPSAPREPPAIGYLSRLSPSLGLDILLEAFILLKKAPHFDTLRLRATGGTTADDKPFVDGLRQRAQDAGVADAFEILPGFRREHRIEFLKSVRVLSVPVPGGEAFGTYLLEAMACGVPAVQPDVGAFPELIAATGGGITYEPNTPEALADALAGLLDDPQRLAALGTAGLKSVAANFSVDRMARDLIQVYQECMT